jgi:hypothetical protein
MANSVTGMCSELSVFLTLVKEFYVETELKSVLVQSKPISGGGGSSHS